MYSDVDRSPAHHSSTLKLSRVEHFERVEFEHSFDSENLNCSIQHFKANVYCSLHVNHRENV